MPSNQDPTSSQEGTTEAIGFAIAPESQSQASSETATPPPGPAGGVTLQDSPLSSEQLDLWLREISGELHAEMTRMRAEEDWVLDDQDSEFAAALLTLGRLLAGQTPVNVQTIIHDSQKMDRLADVLAYTSTPRAIRLLSLLSQRSQESVGGHLLQACLRNVDAGEAEQQITPEHHLMFKRIRLLISRGCYRRVFGPERRQETLELIRQIQIDR